MTPAGPDTVRTGRALHPPPPNRGDQHHRFGRPHSRERGKQGMWMAPGHVHNSLTGVCTARRVAPHPRNDRYRAPTGAKLVEAGSPRPERPTMALRVLVTGASGFIGS